MKILTNVQTSHLAGISQTFSSFLGFLEEGKKKNVKITGIDIQKKLHLAQVTNYRKTEGIFTLIATVCDHPPINEAAKASNNLQDMENLYKEVIGTYHEAIKTEKPDLILLNGTYILPWCLFIASRGYDIPTVLHYHGILTKEVAHWEEKPRLLLNQMEKSFDKQNLYYIFPSNLAKKVVENEVYGHKIRKSSILPNPVPRHFFEVKRKSNSKNIGIVSSWSRVKNYPFIKAIAKHNQKHGNQFSINVVTNLQKRSKDYMKTSKLVKFRVPMSNQKLANFYGQMGVVISPSVFETYGNVAQEALAANTPALVNSQMGVSETFRNLGLQDWIMDFGSVSNIYRKAKEISKQEVGSKIRKIIYNEYSPKRINSQLLKILKST